MDAPWRVELLGGLRAVRGEQVLTRFATQKVAALLAYLAFYRERAHPRDELVELLWPQSEPEAGRRRLRVALTSLRHQLEPAAPGGRGWGAVLVANRRSVQLNPAACTTDVAAFEAAWREASRAGMAGERVPRLAAAVGLYRGELLPGYFDDWILPHRQWLAEAYQQALGQLVRLLQEAGDRGAALLYARRAVAADPLREEAREELIRLLAGTGAPTAALKEYAALERLLEREWGATPAPEIRALVHGLRGQGPGVRGQDRPLTPDPWPLPPAPCIPEPVNPPPPLPTGTVTFLLVDLEEAAAPEQEQVQAWLRPLFRGHGGHELQAGGRTLQVSFGRASDALAAAVAGMKAVGSGQRAVASSDKGDGTDSEASSSLPPPAASHAHGPRPTGSCPRMALHTGEVEPGEDLATSAALQHTLRLLWAAHPGQILVTERSAVLLHHEGTAGPVLVDLGLYRLADQSSPERLFQACPPELSAQRFPPPQAAPAQSGNLPLQLTRFVGREAEIAQLLALLGEMGEEAGGRGGDGATGRGGDGAAGRPAKSGTSRPVTASVPSPPVSPSPRLPPHPWPSPRLITLTGPGGSGKTRLALAAAARLCVGFQEGAPLFRAAGGRSVKRGERSWRGGGPWFVPLADLSDPALIPDQILEALGLPRSPQLEPLEQVASALSSAPFAGE